MSVSRKCTGMLKMLRKALRSSILYVTVKSVQKFSICGGKRHNRGKIVTTACLEQAL